MGGQFERLIGVMKQSMYKAIGNGHLHWHEFEEVILDVKTILNNRPPGYVEDYIQMPILTPNLMLFEQLSQIPEEEPAKVEDYDLRKCAKYQRKCKDVLWNRWTTECLKALRERHNLNHQTKEATLKEGDVFLIKGEEQNRSKWTCDRSERKRGRRDAES